MVIPESVAHRLYVDLLFVSERYTTKEGTPHGIYKCNYCGGESDHCYLSEELIHGQPITVLRSGPVIHTLNCAYNQFLTACEQQNVLPKGYKPR